MVKYRHQTEAEASVGHSKSSGFDVDAAAAADSTHRASRQDIAGRLPRPAEPGWAPLSIARGARVDKCMSCICLTQPVLQLSHA